jgi:hypothetical protein
VACDGNHNVIYWSSDDRDPDNRKVVYKCEWCSYKMTVPIQNNAKVIKAANDKWWRKRGGR